MARFARIVMPGTPCHITQRSNNQQDVFFVDDDRRVYLELLRKAAQQFGLAVHGYCLKQPSRNPMARGMTSLSGTSTLPAQMFQTKNVMTNHVHLVATPVREDSLAKASGRTHLTYAQYVNRLHGRSGHVWQNRFYSCLLDEDHYWAALHYVERNPVRARLVRLPWRYPWSSAAVHTGRAEPTGLLEAPLSRE